MGQVCCLVIVTYDARYVTDDGVVIAAFRLAKHLVVFIVSQVPEFTLARLVRRLAEEKDDIIYLVGTGDFSLWRPLLYVIPRTPQIDARIQAVPMAQRAGVGPEFIIPDLARDEFDIIEL